MSQLQINQDFQEKVKERIGDMVADMLTDEQLNDMIKVSYEQTIKNFIDVEVKKMMTEDIKKNIGDHLQEQYNSGSWGVKINENVKQMVIDNSGAILASIMSDSIQVTLNNLYSNLHSSGININRY